MMKSLRFIPLLLALAGGWGAQAQVVSSSAPLGGRVVSVTAASDSLVSVPFQRPSAWVGQVSSVSSPTLAVAGSPAWTANQWVYAAGTQSNTYFALFLSGAKTGHSYTVTGNDASDLTLELLNDDLSGVAAGDNFELIPYWTLSTLFPAATAGTAFVATATVGTWGTELVLTDPHTPSLNFAAVNTYYFYNGAWRSTTASPTVDQSDIIVRSDVPFRLRNAGSALTWSVAGAVYTGPQALALPTSSTGPVDDPVALMWPLQVTLNSLALTGGAAFLDSPSLAARTDLLMVYDNGTAQLNKPAASYYIHYNGAWHKLGQPLTQDFGTDPVFGPYYSVVVRKAATVNGGSTLWLAPTP